MRDNIDLFTPVVPDFKLNSNFTAIKNRPGYLPARMMLNEAYQNFSDVDGNFIEQFQTTGFDARLWELYLNTVLIEQGFVLDRSLVRPDFKAIKSKRELLIESVTTNPTQGQSKLRKPDAGEDFYQNVIAELEYATIKFGSALHSKLKKRYWELPHAKNKILIIAIEAFHDEQSLHFNDATLWKYLYGLYPIAGFNENGELIGKAYPRKQHISGEKIIPSGFFSQPDAENVSAILFSNSGTISKFNRMGYLRGYGQDSVKMIRWGLCYDHDPQATEPFQFRYEVGNLDFPEDWSQGIHIFHNPNAKQPLPLDYSLFKNGITQQFILDNEPYGLGQPLFSPIASQTAIFAIGDK